MRSVLVVGWELPPVFRYGGLSTFMWCLARALKELGRDVVVLGAAPRGWPHPPEPGECIEVDGVAVCRFGTVTDLGEENCCALCTLAGEAVYRFLQVLDAEMVLVNDFHVACAGLAAAGCATPCVHYVHVPSLHPTEAASYFACGRVATNSALMLEKVVRPTLMVLSEFFQRPEPRATVVHPAAPPMPRPEPGYDLKSEVSRALGTECGKVVLVVARGNQPEKNAQILPLVVRELGDGWCGAVAGRGWPSGRLGDRVAVLGELPPQRLAAAMATADVLLVPSTFEPFGIVALEAASLGTPVALAPMVGAREVLKSAPVAQSLDPRHLADAVRKALQVDTEALRREATSRTWRDVAAELLELARSGPSTVSW